MRKLQLLLSVSFCLFMFSKVPGQTYINLQDNYVVSSNSHIIINPGTYAIADPGNDGLLQLNNVENVIIEGTSVFANGSNSSGYVIKINNSKNITIKNFGMIRDYFYAVEAKNADSLFLNGNNFSYNKVDSTGWISIWTDYQQALGGGVMMYNCNHGRINNNNMKFQNDGVALYHCDDFEIDNNDFSWNTSFGIRMYFTDSCYIHQNNASHVNRPYTDPSDCAALLVLVSNENLVEYNDLSYSGDGVFLGQYEYSNIPNNNKFFYNECSNSPHNAIEATFADGNIYKHNNCNDSHYGLWLGYSFNTVVDSNQIIGNYNSGIAVDRGFNNQITNNIIQRNPIGIELWEGGNITGYENQWSHDYYIAGNNITGNTKGIHSSKSEHMIVKNNNLDYNRDAAIYFEGLSGSDTIENNSFRFSTVYHMQSTSSNNIKADNNSFQPTGDAYIGEKTAGNITWQPYQPLPAAFNQSIPYCDLTEEPSVWQAYPEIGYGNRSTETLIWDSTDKKVGAASLKLKTGRGWYVALNYRSKGDTLPVWSFNDTDSLYFWVKTIKQPTYGFQFFHIRIGNRTGGYYRYSSSPGFLNAANQTWKRYGFPLSGTLNFNRSTVGNVNLSDINYVEFWADTWDYGFTLWLDGVSFNNCEPYPVYAEELTLKLEHSLFVENPAKNSISGSFNNPQNGWVKIDLIDLKGNTIQNLLYGQFSTGRQVFNHAVNCSSGVYLLRFTTSGYTESRKICIMR